MAGLPSGSPWLKPLNNGMRILTPGTPHATVTAGPANCRLDVVQGPNEALYYSDDAHIYRLG